MCWACKTVDSDEKDLHIQRRTYPNIYKQNPEAKTTDGGAGYCFMDGVLVDSHKGG